MNFSYSAVFVFLSLHCVVSAPAKKPMYNAIAEKCPRVKSIPDYKNQKLFDSCKDWEVISAVDKLTSDNHDEVRCLLYFQSFTSYCTQVKNLNVTVPKDVIVGYDINMICNYMKTIPHKNLSAIFATEADCQSVCLDNMNFINSVCSVSYYFLHPSVDGLQIGLSQSKNLTYEKVSLKNISTNSNVGIQNLQPGDSRLDTKPASEHLESADSHINGNGNKKNSADTDVVDSPKQSPPQVQHAAAPAVETVNADNRSNAKLEQQLPDGDQNQPSIVHTQESNPLVNAPAAPAVADKPQEQSHDDKEYTQSEANPVEIIPNKNEKKQENVDEVGQIPQKDSGNEDVNREIIPLDPDNEQIDAMEDGRESGNQEETQDTSQNIVPSEKNSKPVQGDNTEAANYSAEMEGDSYFFTYFMILCIIFIAGYVCYHNKQKILALILEGRRGKRQYRGRRPNSANYHKLDSNLEEAINSSCKKNTNNVIY